MGKYERSEYLSNLAEQVIAAKESLHEITKLGVRIAYRTSTQAKMKGDNTVFGDCEKVTEKNKMYMNYDFVITVYEPNVEGWDENRLKVLLWHELRHVGIKETDDGFSTFIVPHDFEDFFDIYNAFGIGWECRDDLPDICEVK